MAHLLLLRHGESAWNAEGRWQGWADPPLSPLGEAQSRAAVEWLGELDLDGWGGFAGVVSSDLERARRTAAIVADGLGLGEVEKDPRLRERDVGDWCSLTADEISARFPGLLEEWRAGNLRRPPGGEDDDTMAGRILRSLGRLAARPGGPLLVVTHGGVVRLLDRRLGLEPMHPSNLCGRWYEPAEPANPKESASEAPIVPGEPVYLPDLGDPEDQTAAAAR